MLEIISPIITSLFHKVFSTICIKLYLFKQFLSICFGIIKNNAFGIGEVFHWQGKVKKSRWANARQDLRTLTWHEKRVVTEIKRYVPIDPNAFGIGEVLHWQVQEKEKRCGNRQTCQVRFANVAVCEAMLGTPVPNQRTKKPPDLVAFLLCVLTLIDALPFYSVIY